MKQILETKRLILRELDPDDAEFIVKLLNTPTWLKFIGDRGVKNTDDAKNYLLNGPIKSYNTFGFGLYLVQLKNGKTPIGMCGLIKRDFLENADIGFALLPEYEGKGYGYEAASATLAYAQKELRLQRIVAITVKENVNSIHLLEKIGLRAEGTIIYPGTDEELLLFGTHFKDQNIRLSRGLDMIGRSPINPFLFVVGKIAFLSSGFFFLINIVCSVNVLYGSTATSVIGMILIAAGFCLAGAALFHLGESTAVGLPNRKTVLKTHGLYRFTRNPVYLGGFFMCIGSCLYTMHFLNILFFVIALSIHHAIVKKEEEFLENKFGEQWLEYKKRVPRYF